MAAISSEPTLQPPEGFAIGHWTDPVAETGCTVILPPTGSRCGVDVRGGGPGSRETEIISPFANPQTATAVLLTGGSAFGLAAADGVVRWCEERGRGYMTPGGLVPLVPAAVIYDLLAGDGTVRPGPDEGYAAAESARTGIPERGPVGAGAGAAVSKLRGRENAVPGGTGYAATRLGSGELISALAVVNATGDVLGPDGAPLACARGEDGEPVRSIDLIRGLESNPYEPQDESMRFGDRQATTLVCLMSDLHFDKLSCSKLARMASAGVARAVQPVFTPFDGDIVFALASGEQRPAEPWELFAAGSIAAEVVSDAIRDAVTAGARA